jgi:hypothetical protein
MVLRWLPNIRRRNVFQSLWRLHREIGFVRCSFFLDVYAAIINMSLSEHLTYKNTYKILLKLKREFLQMYVTIKEK